MAIETSQSLALEKDVAIVCFYEMAQDFGQLGHPHTSVCRCCFCCALGVHYSCSKSSFSPGAVVVETCSIAYAGQKMHFTTATCSTGRYMRALSLRAAISFCSDNTRADLRASQITSDERTEI
ncbi:uncharacterized protein ZBAI_07629 [Zygosaccharomyces bailii ISA1307]|nr:uncharacterized protein ZBAI_07629 [Zygosaccharomyces bailii ISA1307]